MPVYASPVLQCELIVDPALADVAAAMVTGWQPDSGSAPVRIRVLAALPEALPAGVPLQMGRLQGVAADGYLFLGDDTCSLKVDYVAKVAEIRLAPAIRQELAFCRDVLWRLAVIELARTQGRYHLHAAAIDAEGGHLICAEGGVGKSTFAAAAHHAGLAVLSDDAVMLLPDSPPSVARLPAPWGLSGKAAQWCGLAEDPAKQRFWPPLGPERLPVRALCLAMRGERTAAVPIQPQDALTTLIRQHPLLLASRTLATDHLKALSLLVEQVPCYRLTLGADLLADPFLVRRLLPM